MTQDIINVEVNEALSERYLSYALSTIMSRSLPSAQDGLKPVHRRLLYSMYLLKLDPSEAFKKCSRVVGDVIGKFHPHGEQAIYDSLVRLAQDFSLRYPLIEGQGNFGSIDGDNPAAMRYTESRLTKVTSLLLADIGEDTVPFKPNYDGNNDEPEVLPAAFPNLLANGAEGIAVGMATSIPSHNIDELCGAILHRLNHPECGISELVELLPGPDFATGGVIVETQENLLSIYETGRGSIRLRSRYHIEELKSGQYQIVVTEIPYMVKKSKLIESIAELYRDKKLPLLGDLADESAEDVRVIFSPRSRNIEPEVFMESLFATTELEVKINCNFNALDKQFLPKVMNLGELIDIYLDHRKAVILARTEHRISKAKHRLETLGGLLIAYLNLDEVIRIIREEDDPKQELIARFALTEVQSEAILNMRLRNLRKLEEMEIRKEQEKLSKELELLEKIKATPKLVIKEIERELSGIRDNFGAKTGDIRRTTIEYGAVKNFSYNLEDYVEKEKLTIIFSEKKWLSSIKGHELARQNFFYKEGDSEGVILELMSTDKLIFFTDEGKAYTVAADRVTKSKTGGDPISLLVDVAESAKVLAVYKYNPELKVTLLGENGKGFTIQLSECLAQTKNGKQIYLNSKSSLKLVLINSGTHLAMVGTNRRLVIIANSEIPELKKGSGVILQKYRTATLSSAKFIDQAEGLTFSMGERIRRETNIAPWTYPRGAMGKMPPLGFSKDNKF